MQGFLTLGSPPRDVFYPRKKNLCPSSKRNKPWLAFVALALTQKLLSLSPCLEEGSSLPARESLGITELDEG